MKRLTLSKTWTECLRMWKWIAEQAKKNDEVDVIKLKTKWTKKHGYKDVKILKDCFFCDWAGSSDDRICECPAKKIDPNFKCCNSLYYYHHKPLAFYAKLVELNKKRKAKK